MRPASCSQAGRTAPLADINLASGLSNDPARVGPGTFWGYFHRSEDLQPELEAAGFEVEAVLAVEA